MKYNTPLNRLLLVNFFFIVLLLIMRAWYTGSVMYLFLLWNIFLAWVPFALSQGFSGALNKPLYLRIGLFSIWLLFFPNALYIVTDLVHLETPSSAPVWFDSILIFSSTIMGLAMAFVSLRRVEVFLLNYFSSKVTGAIIPSILMAGSFGVYLGRFQRWNSWDAFFNPISLAIDVAERIIFIQHHPKTWVVTFILSFLFMILYGMIKMISELKPK
jgi:uncharacterized membrane protein